MVPLKPLTRIAPFHRQQSARLRPASAEDRYQRCSGCAAAGTLATARCGVPSQSQPREGGGR